MFDFRTFSFGAGNHSSRADGMCLMEAVAYVAGEEHTDHPKCACPVLGAFLRNWNDGLRSDDERNRLLARFVFRLPGTRAAKEIESQRMMMCLRWLVNTFTPAFLELVPSLREQARNLRRARVDERNLTKVQTLIAAAWAAAGDAAGDAAGVAAWVASRAAARAVGAAWAAAGAAAGDAAGVASRAALKSTVVKLQKSALRLVDRMIRLTEPREKSMRCKREACAV